MVRERVGRDRLLVADARGAEEFLRRVGFEMEDGVFGRRVR